MTVPEAMALPATSADAPPPNPLNAATSCGMAVIGTRSASAMPSAAPTPRPMAINSKLTILWSSNVTTTATSMPSELSAFPRRAVRMPESPRRPRINSVAATR